MKISNRHLNFNLVKTALYFLYFQNHVLPQIFTFPQLESTGGQAKNTFFFFNSFYFLIDIIHSPVRNVEGKGVNYPTYIPSYHFHFY